MNKTEIFCTLGPSSLNKSFLRFINNKIDLVRINMSHIEIKKLPSILKFIKKNTSVPICIDTEGAQIRSKVKIKKKFKKGKKIILYRTSKSFNLYPENVFEQLRSKDILDIGFEGLSAKVIKKSKDHAVLSCMSNGVLENNKGIHIRNRNIKLNFITNKDIKAIEISKKFKIKNYALSFTNNLTNIKEFEKLIPNGRKIYKIETLEALKNLKKMFKKNRSFLIDRGDLSKDLSIENIPRAQRYIFKQKKIYKNNIKISVATNFLESMINNNFSTRAEINDIYNSLEMGADGLVLAAETAVGKYPAECIILLKKVIKNFYTKNHLKFYQ